MKKFTGYPPVKGMGLVKAKSSGQRTVTRGGAKSAKSSSKQAKKGAK